MKKIIGLFSLVSILAFAGIANGQTSNGPVVVPEVTTVPTNNPIVDSPIFQFFTAQSTNWYIGTYGIYDTTSKDYGVGFGAGYKVSDFVVAVMRLDILSGGVYVPSGNIQLQVPVKIMNKFVLSPFLFTGVATSLNSDQDNGQIIGIFGFGGIVDFANDKWYLPDAVIADWERWTGGPFENNQVRVGLMFRL